MNEPMKMETIKRQKTYVAKQIKKGLDKTVVHVGAFLRGMRELGYKSPLWALAELIDNAVQAAAHEVHIVFDYSAGNESQAKPDQIAIYDDGVGMIPEMISFAVRWGGTDREDDRSGFGRFGYGLPSAAVSLAKRYSVYSRPEGEDWHAVHVDVEALAADPLNAHELLTARPEMPPEWVFESLETVDGSAAAYGTAVVLEEMDRLRRWAGWIVAKVLENKLLEGLGVIYRHWLPDIDIVVNGRSVKPVDPLFLMEHSRHFDETPIKAEQVEARVIEMEGADGSTGTIKIRASFLPPNFNLKDPATYQPKMRPTKAELAQRFGVMKDYNGILITREGRQIDCIQPRWTRFQVNDRYIKVEIDFSAELDEFFGVTTAKQQIVIDDSMWEKLQHDGRGGGALIPLVRDLRKSFKETKSVLDAEARAPKLADEPSASERAMQESEQFTKVRVGPSEEKVEQAKKNLEDEVTQRAAAAGIPTEAVKDELIDSTRRRPFAKDFKAIDEGPFFIPKRVGEQKVLVINTAHEFYTTVYEPAPADVRDALEVLLFVLAEAELNSEGPKEAFYKAGRHEWSARLRNALEALSPAASMADKKAAAAAEWESEKATVNAQ